MTVGKLTLKPGLQAFTFHSGNRRQYHSMIMLRAALLALYAGHAALLFVVELRLREARPVDLTLM